MEVKIGIQNVGREIVFESSQTADAVADVVAEALSSQKELRLKDDKGRLIMVPAGVIGYVEIGAEEVRRVGFGAL
ncbi:DUF3107 domain-containing protein [Arthrobacter gengyunqii]|uniref:DUF3107 domain-containing protein n=1 Tax=Arthrobacter gengyunqii TaxID=2886940 RepID=A0A9X1LYK9_9MICC|nr:DUF3107 domain-containing protein [Arthrobacter gengyunqii]MCC3267240.1 DUF3107 domain-containing protein [Arthrobacter gengyunqii]MCC3268023.1 DUF3107 domain-containing protein [Arthrobacter gengyunqii]UOY95443.1 DUF3107 domain-containing protein [Arthrobacter gengyunqii]